MNSLLESFVAKLHTHVVTVGAENGSGGVARQLLSVLASDTTTIHLNCQALNTLSLLRQNEEVADLLLNEGGLLAILRFMTRIDRKDVPIESIVHIHNLVSLADTSLLSELKEQSNATESGNPISTLLQWFAFLPPGHPHYFFSFLSLCCEKDTTLCPEVDLTLLAADYFDRWRNEMCADSEEILFAIKIAIVCIKSCTALFEVWWERCGEQLLNSYCMQTTRWHTSVVDVVYILFASIPTTARVTLTVDSPLYEALSCEVLKQTSIKKMNSILMNHHIAELLLHDACFKSAFFCKSLEEFHLLELSERLLTLEYLTVAAAHNKSHISMDVYREFYHHMDFDTATRPPRALLYCTGVASDEVAPSFSKLMQDNITYDVPELDNRLCEHFEALLACPQHIGGRDGFLIHGHPPLVIFHCIEYLVGRGPLGTTRVGQTIYKFLSDTMHQVLRNTTRLTSGMSSYLKHLSKRFGIACDSLETLSMDVERDECAHKVLLQCVATCPITLHPLHCPVVASDGNTYEMQALLRVLQQPCSLSPLTRERLWFQMTFNRTLQDKEEQLWNLMKTTAARGTHRRARQRRRSAQATAVVDDEERSDC